MGRKMAVSYKHLVMADYVLLNDPTADSNGAVNCTCLLYTSPQGRVLNAGRSLFQHCRLAGGIVNGQAMGSFVFGHLQHSSHPPLKQRSQLGIHLSLIHI